MARSVRRRAAVLAALLAAPALAGCQGGAAPADAPPSGRSPAAPAEGAQQGTDVPVRRLIYAAQSDGTVHVYDIAAGHRPLTTFTVFACCVDVRGLTASAATHRLVVMYNRAGEGHVAAVDIPSNRVLWDRVVHRPGVDRGNITPDGSRLYVPTWEADPSAGYELVLDPSTGAELARVALPPRSHDTIVSLDGRRVFMETKSATGAMYVADSATNRVVATIAGYCCGGVLAPFAIDGAARRVVNDVNGLDGFQVADVGAGHVVATVRFSSANVVVHGIAWTPDERQVWAAGATPVVHVVDMTGAQPRPVRDVVVGHGPPHWVTFSIDGSYAYVAGPKGANTPTEVIDAHSYRRVGVLSPSEDLLEVDLAGASVAAVGNQFGVGRVAG